MEPALTPPSEAELEEKVRPPTRKPCNFKFHLPLACHAFTLAFSGGHVLEKGDWLWCPLTHVRKFTLFITIGIVFFIIFFTHARTSNTLSKYFRLTFTFLSRVRRPESGNSFSQSDMPRSGNSGLSTHKKKTSHHSTSAKSLPIMETCPTANFGMTNACTLAR